MNVWRTALVCALVVLAPTLTACAAGGAAADGVASREITYSTAGTIGGAAADTVTSHELSK